MEKETEKQKLIAELNQLSENFEKNKDRMVEIAKILLTDHYKYLPRNKNKWNNVKDVEKKSAEDDPKNIA